jgi:hypothetical protein
MAALDALHAHAVAQVILDHQVSKNRESKAGQE